MAGVSRRGGAGGRAVGVAAAGGGMMIALSDGLGIQSTTIKAMCAFGDLPMVDVAIHADTKHERTATYDYKEEMQAYWDAAGIRSVTVSGGRYPDPMSVRGLVGIPAFTTSDKHGQPRRFCTNEWKIAPIRRWLQANRNGEPVELWLGISLDEVARAKPSDVKYITNKFPLLDKRMTRNDCIKYLTDKGIAVPPKSSCVFCPYHNKSAWRELYQHGNGDWHKAVEVDEAIRKARPPYDLYLHSTRKPLREIAEQVDAQPELDLTSEECEGYCFL